MQETPNCLPDDHGKIRPTFGTSESKNALLARHRPGGIVDKCKDFADGFAQLRTVPNPAQNRYRHSVEIFQTPQQALRLGGNYKTFPAPEEVVDRRSCHPDCHLNVVNAHTRLTTCLDDPDRFVEDLLLGGVMFHHPRP
jgi:hypothetical protein